MTLELASLPKAISKTPEIEALIRAGAAVACGVSAGKDSVAAAIATWAYLDSVGHRGPRALMHADLGMVEWETSGSDCEALARHLGAELIVVRRAAGGLMERWESRWESSVRRYGNLETVTLVPCWSTASLRFCTAETKVHPLNAEMRRRWRGMPIVNVTGVRREESSARARSTVSQYESAHSRRDTPIYSWRPIVDYKVADVFETMRRAGVEPHIAYTQYGSSRLSCRFCMLASIGDHRAAVSNPASHDLLRRMVQLEVKSTFAFQGARWLGDLAPDVIDNDLLEALNLAKKRADLRRAAEAQIPKAMRFEKGWPTRMIEAWEADILAGVRREVCGLMGFDATYTDRESVMARYEDLLKKKGEKGVSDSVSGVQLTLGELLQAA